MFPSNFTVNYSQGASPSRASVIVGCLADIVVTLDSTGNEKKQSHKSLKEFENVLAEIRNIADNMGFDDVGQHSVPWKTVVLVSRNRRGVRSELTLRNHKIAKLVLFVPNHAGQVTTAVHINRGSFIQ